MGSTRFAATALLFLSLTACGDAREEFSGNYGFTGDLTFGAGVNEEVIPVQGQLEIIADHFDSERIFLNWNCGINGKVEAENLELSWKECPSIQDDCTFMYQYERGNARIDDGSALTLSISGKVVVRCENASGDVFMGLNVTGERGKKMPLARPGQQDLGGEPGPAALQGTVLQDALRRAIGAAPQGE